MILSISSAFASALVEAIAEAMAGVEVFANVDFQPQRESMDTYVVLNSAHFGGCIPRPGVERGTAVSTHELAADLRVLPHYSKRSIAVFCLQ